MTLETWFHTLQRNWLFLGLNAFFGTIIGITVEELGYGYHTAYGTLIAYLGVTTIIYLVSRPSTRRQIAQPIIILAAILILIMMLIKAVSEPDADAALRTIAISILAALVIYITWGSQADKPREVLSETADRETIRVSLDTKSYRENSDPGLVYAWRIFAEYDQASINRKDASNWIKERVIFIALGVSILAVVSTFVRPQGSTEWLYNSLLVLLIILPAIGAAMMGYASKFTPGLLWINYRVAAEAVKRHIYLYRMCAGPYEKPSDLAQALGLDEKEIDPKLDYFRRQLLLEKVSEGRDLYLKELEGVVPTLQELNLGENSTIEIVKPHTDNEKDDGFTEMEMDQYIQYRIGKQHDWYTGRTLNDFRKARQFSALALASAAAGSVVAGLSVLVGSYESEIVQINNPQILVVITTALMTTFANYAQLYMYGQTYSLYENTSHRVGDILAAWEAKSPEDRKNRSQQAEFVKKFEDAFQQERVSWRKIAIQAQTTVETAIMKSIESKEDVEAANRT